MEMLPSWEGGGRWRQLAGLEGARSPQGMAVESVAEWVSTWVEVSVLLVLAESAMRMSEE